jgi:nucleoside-diphosphate-sugar epimerase
MSAAPTVAMLAAVTNSAYEIPFTGPFPFLYVREAASAFVKAVSEDREGAGVYDLNGVASTIEAVLDIIKSEVPDAPISAAGGRFPFPDDITDAPLEGAIGAYRKWPLAEGIAETQRHFRRLVEAGKLSAGDVR